MERRNNRHKVHQNWKHYILPSEDKRGLQYADKGLSGKGRHHLL